MMRYVNGVLGWTKSILSCIIFSQIGRVPEWFMGTVLKTVVGESLP